MQIRLHRNAVIQIPVDKATGKTALKSSGTT